MKTARLQPVLVGLVLKHVREYAQTHSRGVINAHGYILIITTTS